MVAPSLTTLLGSSTISVLLALDPKSLDGVLYNGVFCVPKWARRCSQRKKSTVIPEWKQFIYTGKQRMNLVNGLLTSESQAVPQRPGQRFCPIHKAALSNWHPAVAPGGPHRSATRNSWSLSLLPTHGTQVPTSQQLPWVLFDAKYLYIVCLNTTCNIWTNEKQSTAQWKCQDALGRSIQYQCSGLGIG